MSISVDRERIARALALYGESPGISGPTLLGDFVLLPTALRLSALKAPELRPIHHTIEPIRVSVSTLFTLAARLQWQLELRDRREMSEGVWVYFTSLDVEYFIISMRMVFDQIARALRIHSPKPGQIPTRFSRLRAFVNTERATELMAPETIAFVRRSDWFDAVKSWRDLLLHRDGWTLAFIVPETITFQINEHFAGRVQVRELMYNENVVDFRRFAALLMSYLLTDLEELSGIVRQQTGVTLRYQGGNAHMGVEVIAEWTKLLLVGLSAPPGPQSHGALSE